MKMATDSNGFQRPRPKILRPKEYMPEQAHVLGRHRAVQHVRRESNVWADELSNLQVDGFNPLLRIDITRYEAESLIALPRPFALAKAVSSPRS